MLGKFTHMHVYTNVYKTYVIFININLLIFNHYRINKYKMDADDYNHRRKAWLENLYFIAILTCLVIFIMAR